MRLMILTLFMMFSALAVSVQEGSGQNLESLSNFADIQMSSEEASADIEQGNITIIADGEIVTFSSCSANVCGKCSISCPAGQSANCLSGKIQGDFCVREPSCKCRN